MRIDVFGIELRGYHGVLPEERSEGQRFAFDVTLELPEPAADEIGATIDYRDVVTCVRDVSDAQSYRLLETLAAEVADELKRRLPAAELVRVRVGKPDLELDGGYAAITVER
jgi:dihydroneopterin aldolase